MVSGCHAVKEAPNSKTHSPKLNALGGQESVILETITSADSGYRGQIGRHIFSAPGLSFPMTGPLRGWDDLRGSHSEPQLSVED